MALSKVNYVDNQTVITAQNLNDIQNEIIQNTELIKKAAPRNLLDNTDWINLVNQRGVTNESIPNRIFIDRWLFDRSKETGAYSLGTDGITFGAGTWLKQFLPYTQSQMDGKTFTVVIWLADGTVWLKSLVFTAQDSYVSAPWSGQGIGTYFNRSYWSVTLANVPDCTIKYVALYEGEYTIDTLPEYQPKGYGAELAECQRYYQIRSANNIAAVDMRPTMRLSSPTITSVTGGYAYSADL